jgi:hypothetical protein
MTTSSSSSHEAVVKNWEVCVGGRYIMNFGNVRAERVWKY